MTKQDQAEVRHELTAVCLLQQNSMQALHTAVSVIQQISEEQMAFRSAMIWGASFCCLTLLLDDLPTL